MDQGKLSAFAPAAIWKLNTGIVNGVASAVKGLRTQMEPSNSPVHKRPSTIAPQRTCVPLIVRSQAISTLKAPQSLADIATIGGSASSSRSAVATGIPTSPLSSMCPLENDRSFR